MPETRREADFVEPHHGPRWGRIVLIGTVLLVAALFVAHAIWGRGAGGRLAKQVAAYKAAGEPIEPADFIVNPPVPDADNAVLDLRNAIAAIQETDASKQYDQLEENPDFPLRDNEIALLRKIAADNAAVYTHVEKATTKPGADWQLNFTSIAPMIQMLLPHLNPQRNLARMVAADAMLAHHDGDDARALRRIEQVLFVGRVNDKSPLLISHLVAVGIGALGTDRLKSIAYDLKVGADAQAATRQQVEHLIKQLLDDQPQKDGQRNAFFGERAAQLDTVRALLNGKLSLNQIIGAGGPGGGNAAANVAAAVAGYALKPTFNADGLMMLRQTTATLDAAQKAADYPAFQQTKPAFPLAANAKPWQNVLARLMMPSLDRAILTDFRHTADRRLTATMLAIRLYALDHNGQLPPTLSALAPKYLPAVPLDPLAAGGKPLGFVADPSRPMLYSVGENAIDDGGSTQPFKTRRPDPSPWEQMDYVVHLTRQPRPVPTPLDDGVGGLSTQPAPPATTQDVPSSTQPAS